MAKLYSAGNWIIKMQGNEHPPVHVHVLHPDGRATIALGGAALNNGVPISVLKQAQSWVRAHTDTIRAEWTRMNNPPDRDKDSA